MSVSPPPPLSPSGGSDSSTSPNGKEKVWHAGTLTYTSAGLGVLFFWLLWGDFAWSMKERSVTSVVQLLLKKFAASDMLTGIMIGSLPALIGMVLGPIISYKSDRHRGRWGRRIPFLAIPTPIASLSMVGLAFSPVFGRWMHEVLGASSPGLNVSTLIFFGIFWTSFEFATLAANAVFGALINDVVPRPFLGRFYGMFRALSLIAGMIFNYWLFGKAENHYVWVFIGIGTLYGVGFTMMCLKVKEGDYPPPPIDTSEAGGFFAAVKLYFKDCFSHPYYLWVFAALTLSGVAFLPVNLFSVYFAKSMNMDMDKFGKLFALTYLISLGMSYPLGALADRFHPVKVGMVAIALYAAVTLWGGLFATTPFSFSIAMVGHGVISGSWFTTTASIGQRLFPQAKFAQFASAQALVLSVSTILVPPIIGKFLDVMHHVYRYTFLASGLIAVAALFASFILYRRFMKLGGPNNYVAPM